MAHMRCNALEHSVPCFLHQRAYLDRREPRWTETSESMEAEIDSPCMMLFILHNLLVHVQALNLLHRECLRSHDVPARRFNFTELPRF